MQMKIQMNLLPPRLHDFQLSYFLLPFLLQPWLLMLLFSCDNLRDSMFGTCPLNKAGGLCEGRPLPSSFCHTSYSSWSTYSKIRKLIIKFAYLCIVLPKSVRALGDFHDLWDATLVVVVLQEDQLFSRFRWLFNLNEMLRHLRCLCLDLWDLLSLHNIIYVNIVQI